MKSIYLNTAYMGPMPPKAKQRIEEWLPHLQDPAFSNFEDRLQLMTGVRAKFAKLLGVSDLNIALGASVSEMVGHVANGIEIHQGDNVLLMENDFPSMILPWMVVAEFKGFQVRLLPKETFLDPALLEAEVDDRTRFIGCSHVMFNTGIRLPVAHIGRIAQKTGVLFLADVSQSFGAMKISADIVKNADILVGVAYKWLLGGYGASFGYFSDRALKEVRRSQAAWGASANMKSTESLLDYTTATLPGAVKFDRGEAGTYLINCATDGGLDTILEQGLDKIERHNLNLARHFLANLPSGFQTYSTAETLSPIVCFKSSKEDAAALKARLAKERIDLTIREGYLRASFHFFNTEVEVNRLLSVL